MRRADPGRPYRCNGQTTRGPLRQLVRLRVAVDIRLGHRLVDDDAVGVRLAELHARALRSARAKDGTAMAAASNRPQTQHRGA